MNPMDAGLKVLTIRRIRKEEVLRVLKNGGDVSALVKALRRAVEEEADVRALVLKRSQEISNLDETATSDEVVATLCLQLCRPDLDRPFRLYKRFIEVETISSIFLEASPV